MKRASLVLLILIMAWTADARVPLVIPPTLAHVQTGLVDIRPLGPNLIAGSSQGVFVFAPLEHRLLMSGKSGMQVWMKGIRADYLGAGKSGLCVLDGLHGRAMIFDAKGRLLHRVVSPVLQKAERVYQDYKGRLYAWTDQGDVRVWPDLAKGPFGIPDAYRPIHRVLRLQGTDMVILEFPLDTPARPKLAMRVLKVALPTYPGTPVAVRLIGSRASGGIYVLVEYLKNTKYVSVERLLLAVGEQGRILQTMKVHAPDLPVDEEFTTCGSAVCQLVLTPAGGDVYRYDGGMR